MRIKADLALLLVAVVWGSAFTAQRVAGQLGGVDYFNGAGYLLAAGIVFPFAFQNGTLDFCKSIPWEQVKWMLIAGFLLFLGSALQQAGFISSLYVVIVPVILIVFWREEPHWLSIMAFILVGMDHDHLIEGR